MSGDKSQRLLGAYLCDVSVEVPPGLLPWLLELLLGLLLELLAPRGPPLVSWPPSTEDMLGFGPHSSGSVFCNIFTRAAAAASAILA